MVAPAIDIFSKVSVHFTGYCSHNRRDAPADETRIVKIEAFSIPGLLLLTPRRFGDDRGFFAETWSRRVLQDAGITLDFVQDNHSLSRRVGTVRGLHFQSPPHAQAKLVRCGRGRLFDVAVDLRRGSPTYGQWAGAELSAENGVQLLIPAGFGHGFVTREPDTEIVYKCSDYYSPECDGGIRWNDPDIGIDWGVSEASGLSDKDAKAPLLADFASPFVWENGK
jgi:dTDP-4-dehydrorhamnose 3,5-epimerase